MNVALKAAEATIVDTPETPGAAKGFNAARRMLLGPAPWLLENCRIEGGVLTFSGWALANYETPEDYTFFVNGSKPLTQQLGLPSENLGRVFPFFPSSRNGAFTARYCITQPDIVNGHLEIAYCNAYTNDPINVWHNTFVPLSMSDPLPSGEQLMRTQGNVSRDRYIVYGYSTALRIDKLLRTYFQRPLSSFKSVLDWGCGCGRVTTHLIKQVSGKVVGIDIDEPNISWCRENLKAQFDACGLMPPTSYVDSSFDLIIGISVFTHLTHEASIAWADEVARLLRPGGIAIFTVHGNSGIARILDDDRIERTLSKGFEDSGRDPRLDKVVADKNYYRATYQTNDVTRKILSRGLEFISSLPAANALVQDFVVLRKSVLSQS